MMQLIITPFAGVGPLKLGMTVAQIRSAIGLPYRTFKKSPASEMLSDAFESNGIYVYYKNPGLCNAIEIAPPSEPTFHGKTILGLPYREAREIVNLIDPKFKEDGSGLIATSSL